MNILSLITDWNKNNFYTGAIKARLSIALNNNFSLIETTHQVSNFSYVEAAHILKSSYKHFPEGTCHIIAVNDSIGVKNGFLAIEKNKQFFFCADNGIPSLCFGSNADKIIAIKKFSPNLKTFPTLSVLVESAIFTLENKSIDNLGEKTSSFSDFKIPVLPTIEKNKITGNIAFVDSYKNGITNIDKQTFDKVARDRAFNIKVGSIRYKIDKLSETYSDVRPGELLALFNSDGLLELAQNEGNFYEILGLEHRSTIIIDFFDS